VGLGQGRQQNSFLPEVHTDFIFAVIARNWADLHHRRVVLFAILFARGCVTCARPQSVSVLLVAGCLLLISLQALINLGVVTGACRPKACHCLLSVRRSNSC